MGNGSPAGTGGRVASRSTECSSLGLPPRSRRQTTAACRTPHLTAARRRRLRRGQAALPGRLPGSIIANRMLSFPTCIAP